MGSVLGQFLCTLMNAEVSPHMLSTAELFTGPFPSALRKIKCCRSGITHNISPVHFMCNSYIRHARDADNTGEVSH